MIRLTQSGVLKFTTSMALATLLSLAAAKAHPSSAPQAPSAPPPPEAQAGNPALGQFRDVLQRYGSISQHPRYGEVWSPSPGTVPPGWSPYPGCRWVFDRQANAWSYQDPTAWGSIVHHYGRWAYDPQGGWLWIADAVSGPGWVEWKSEGDRVSWAALSPKIDGGRPSTGWQSLDAQSFNTGCRPPAPPPPVAYRVPAPPPVYAPAPRPVYVAAPVYRPPVYVPRPHVHFHRPHFHPHVHRPHVHVHVHRPHGHRPHIHVHGHRPHFHGPHFHRPLIHGHGPHFHRPHFHRPHFHGGHGHGLRLFGGGGGFRFAHRH